MLRRRLPSIWLLVQNHGQQRVMDFETAVVINEAQVAKLIHEMAHARPGRADHLSECLLTDLRGNWLGPALLAEVGEQQQHPGEPFLG